MSLLFRPGNHTYLLDNKKVKGVTTILNAGIPKPQLVNWAAKSVAEYVAENQEMVTRLWDSGREPMVQFLKSVPTQKKDEAAIKGTDVHAIAEKLIHGESVEVPEHLVAHVEGYAKLIDQFQIEPILTEKSVANRKFWYAGRFDAIVKLNGETWLLDWKTSSGVYGETSLQTAAYANAEFYVNDGDPDTEYPMPQIDRIGVVHITESGSTLHELGDISESFKIFTHVHYLSSKTDYIKGLVSEPLTPTGATNE
jgi:hypothetical protein